MSFARSPSAKDIELQRRLQEYRGDRPLPDLHDRVVILVDDGLATGSTMRAAVRAVRHDHQRTIVVAVPVARLRHLPPDFRTRSTKSSASACPLTFPRSALWYEDFSQTTDDEVRELLSHDTTRTFPTGV